MTDDEGLSRSDVEVYQKFVGSDISRSRAKELIGDNWETVAQVVSIKNTQKSNEENGVSSDELAVLVDQAYDEYFITSQQFAVAERISMANTAPDKVEATSTEDLSTPDDDLLER